MIPRKLHQVWLGPVELAPLELMEGVNERNPSLEYLLWSGESLSAFNVDVEKLREKLGSWAAVSNYVRLLILQQQGGIYLDCDFKCHKSLEPFVQNGAVAAMQDGGRICNAFMGAEPNHPWINWQLEHFDVLDQRDPASGVYLATGAPRDGLTIVPSHLVYPWLYDAPKEARKPHPESILEHLWAGSWSKSHA